MISCLGKTLILKEKAIRIAKQRNEALKEYLTESNEMEEDNAENEEENPFPSGFGGLWLDTDDPAEIDSNIEEQKIIAKESTRKQKEDNANNEEISNVKGIYITHEFIKKHFQKILPSVFIKVFAKLFICFTRSNE